MSQSEQLKYSENQNEAYKQQQNILLNSKNSNQELDSSQANYNMEDNIQNLQQGAIEQEEDKEEAKYQSLMNKYVQQKDFTLLLQNKIRELQKQQDFYQQIVNSYIYQTGGYLRHKKLSDDEKKKYMENMAQVVKKSSKIIQGDLRKQCKQLKAQCQQLKDQMVKGHQKNMEQLYLTEALIQQKFTQQKQQFEKKQVKSQNNSAQLFIAQEKIGFVQKIINITKNYQFISFRIIQFKNDKFYDLLNKEEQISDLAKTKFLLVSQDESEKFEQYLSKLPNDIIIYTLQTQQYIVLSQRPITYICQLLNIGEDQVEYC